MSKLLPNGWIQCELQELATILQGTGFPKKFQGKTHGEYPFYKVGDISRFVKRGEHRLGRASNYVDSLEVKGMRGKLLPPATVVFAKIGEALKLNRRAVTTVESLVDNNVVGVKGNLAVTDSFLYYFFLTVDMQKYSRATAVPSVRKSDIETISVKLPPANEQKRIVEKIEELFSELDAGMASLRLALAQLGTYRQALLKHAFEGNLTADWRESQGDRLESAETLLAQISAERQTRYDQQLSDWNTAVKQWQADGKPGKKPRKPKKLKVLPEIGVEESAELPDLPSAWAYVRLGMMIDEPQYGTSKKCTYDSDGMGVLRIPNVVSGKIDAKDLKFAQFDADEQKQYQLLEGDVLIIRSNGSISIVGKCAQVSKFDEQFLYAGYLIRLRPHKVSINTNYLTHNLSGHGARRQIEFKAKSTSGVNNINSSEIQSIIIPVCGSAERKQIVNELDEKLSVVEQLEREIEENLQKAEALRQSILKKAFAGQLVPQDPNDEPASDLLARIRATNRRG